MKNMKYLLLTIFTLLSFAAFGQTPNRQPDNNWKGAATFGTNSDTWMPTDSSAWLQIGESGTNKGLLLPRVTDTSAVTNPAFGLAVFSTNDSTFYLFKGFWQSVGGFNDSMFIKNQDSEKQNAVSRYSKSVVDTLTNSTTSKFPLYFSSGSNSFYWDGKRVSLVDSNGNVFTGVSTGTKSSGASSFLNNIAFGNLSLFQMDGMYNTALGYGNMYALHGGNFNTAIGSYSLYTIDSSLNSAVGYKSCFACEVSNSNFIGASSSTLHNKDSILFPNSELVNNNGGIILSGDSIEELMTRNSISRPQTHSFIINFNSPYPKTNDTTDVKSIFGKFLVINDSTIQLYNTIFPISDSGSGGGKMYLSNFLDNVNVIGNNAIATDSNQVVLGNPDNKSIVFGGSAGMSFSSDSAYSDGQVPVWSDSLKRFYPSTNLSADSIFSKSDSLNLSVGKTRFKILYKPGNDTWVGNLVSGWHENLIDTSAWASGILWGGAADYANKIIGKNELMFIWGGYGNVIDSAIASNIMGEHSYITSPTTHGIILGGSLDTIYSGNYTGVFSSQYSTIGNPTYNIINNSVIIGGANSNSLGNYSFLSGRYNYIDSINSYTSILGGTNDTIAHTSNYSFILGSNNYNSGVGTITIGFNAKSKAAGAISMSDMSGTGVTNTLSNSLKAFYTNGYNLTGGSLTATQYRLSDLNIAPSSANDTGTKGEIRITADYIYVCVATNTWVRTALTTW